jgi:hypothetical protein
VYKIEVDVIGSQSLQRLVDGFGDTTLIGVVELCGQEDLVSGYTGCLDASAHFTLISIRSCCVDMTISMLQRSLDSLFDLSWR